MQTPRRKTLTLSPRWQYWVRSKTATELSVLVVKGNLLFPLHDAFERWRHSTNLAPFEGSTLYYGITRVSRVAPMTRVCPNSCVHRLHARFPIMHS
jgi:hypothetical protein